MKKENSTLLKRLSQYSALAAPMLAVSGMASAQSTIVCKDINPDKIFDSPGDTYSLNLNGSGSVDFKLKRIASSGSFKADLIDAFPYSLSNQNAVAGYMISSGTGTAAVRLGYPYALSAGSMIDSNSPWITIADLAGSGSSWFIPILGFYVTSNQGIYGFWPGATDKYVPLRISSGGDTFYGWMRCDEASDLSTFVMKDYAFESTAGQGIAAGAGCNTGIGGVEENPEVSIITYNRILNVNFNASNIAGASISLFDVMGQQMFAQKVMATENEISLAHLSAGAYLVKVENNNTVTSKKIIVH